MTDLIKREDALALFDLIAGGEEYIADRERLIAALPAIDPAAIREAALREAVDACQRIAGNTKDFHADHRRAAGQCAAMILALIGEKK